MNTKNKERTKTLEECSCSRCGSKNVDIVTRVTGYFSKVSQWNKGKLQERQNRKYDKYI